MGVPGLRRTIINALEGGAATFAHSGDVRARAMRDAFSNRRLIPDLLEVKAASAMKDPDFYLWRRGMPSKVGSPMPKSALADWEASIDPIDARYWAEHQPAYSRPALGKGMNPAHHWGVKVKPHARNILGPEFAFHALKMIHERTQPRFAQYAHGTTSLVNLRLSDLNRLYGVSLPEPQPKQVFKLRTLNALGNGLAEMRDPLLASLEP